MTSAPVFRIFGFPVRVRSGFLMFMVLVVLLNGTEFGLWLAAALAGFTLLHELGHAFAARATGASAEISLDFMAGYAAFVPTRQLTRLERAGISFAGPGVQIGVGLVLFVVVNGGFSTPGSTDHLQWAVLWAGPVIGLFNLIPVLPFDGGHILEQFIAVFAPQRARSIMIGITYTIIGAGLVATILVPDLQPFIIFLIIPLLSVLQVSAAHKTQRRRQATQTNLSRAEALAWATGDVSAFPIGTGPSPWFRAHQQLLGGHPEVARTVLLDDLAPSTTEIVPLQWWPPDAAPVDALHRLAFLLHEPLPEPTPDTPRKSALVLASVLVRIGAFEQGGQYAAAAYRSHRDPMLAVLVARAAAALGDSSTAIAWLRAAAEALPPELFSSMLDAAPELGRLRNDPDLARRSTD